MVYIIHISPFQEEDKRTAAGNKLGGRPYHYVGWVKTPARFEARMKEHRSGTGSRILAAANEAGLSLEVVRTFEGATQNEEARIKYLWKNTPKLCPCCTPGALQRDPFTELKPKVSALRMWEDYWQKRGRNWV